MVPIAAKGKEREWDGRGSGVFGWETEEEEDIWELELDFCTWDESAGASNRDNHRTWKTEDDLGMTIGEAMEWRYVRAERAKEEVCSPSIRSEPVTFFPTLDIDANIPHHSPPPLLPVTDVPLFRET